MTLAGVRRDRDADTLRAPDIEPAILDITHPDHIAELAARVDSQAGALRALVKNAAISVNAPVEALPLEEWRRLCEVSVGEAWSTARPRKAGGGPGFPSPGTYGSSIVTVC